ncbi:MAG: hypothetical protein II822_10410 [Prevotella sp.]|nr:hypothetical protein [Prevotella sp.]
MTRKRITEIYRFLSAARMSRMTDDEKIAIITLLRNMKPVAVSIQEAATDALQKAQAEYPDDQHKAMQLAERSMSDVMNEDVTDIDPRVMTADMFQRLCLSNDWTFAQIDELEQEMVRVASERPIVQ